MTTVTCAKCGKEWPAGASVYVYDQRGNVLCLYPRTCQERQDRKAKHD